MANGQLYGTGGGGTASTGYVSFNNYWTDDGVYGTCLLYTSLGYAVHTSAYAPADAIAFGDYKYYNIGDRGTRSFSELRELVAGNGMIGYVAKERVDGKLILPEAVQILKLKANTPAA